MAELRGHPRVGRDLGEGAAEEAPTAPHATPRTRKAPRTGPERFWSHWPARIAFGAALVASGLTHCGVMPLGIPASFAINEVDGEAAIPVDILEPENEPAGEPPTTIAPPEEVKPPTDDSAALAALAARARVDAGAPDDGGLDAGRDGAFVDAATTDSGRPLDLDAAVALGDGAGPVASGPRDPQAIVGAAGDIQVDKVLVLVVVNAEVIRKNPEGANLGRILHGMPQWSDFMRGTDIDPVKDVDWIMISGPSLADTSRDVVLVHMSAPDARVVHAMDVVANNYAQGGAFDAGVGSMKAVRAFADRAERVVLMPRPHVIAVVPSSAAPKVARQLSRAAVPAHVIKGDAAYVRVVDPHHPMPEIPSSITEARVRIVPRDDDGVDIFLEGDTRSPELAQAAAADVAAILRRHNDMVTALMTGNLLGGAETTSEGNLVKVHVVASREQIDTILGLVAGFTGTRVVAPAGSR